MKFVDRKSAPRGESSRHGIKKYLVSRNGTQSSSPGVSPPPWSAGISSLAGIGKLILETQSLRGKILVSKNLVAAIEQPSPKAGALPPAHRHDLDDDRANAPVNARLDVTSRCEQEHNLRPTVSVLGGTSENSPAPFNTGTVRYEPAS